MENNKNEENIQTDLSEATLFEEFKEQVDPELSGNLNDKKTAHKLAVNLKASLNNGIDFITEQQYVEPVTSMVLLMNSVNLDNVENPSALMPGEPYSISFGSPNIHLDMAYNFLLSVLKDLARESVKKINDMSDEEKIATGVANLTYEEALEGFGIFYMTLLTVDCNLENSSIDFNSFKKGLPNSQEVSDSIHNIYSENMKKEDEKKNPN